MQRIRTITVLVLCLSMILAVCAWLVLPDRVALQITADGSPDNVVPKPIAILIPLAVSGGALIVMNKRKEIGKTALVAWLGVVLQAATILINQVVEK